MSVSASVKHSLKHFIPNFEICSVLLLAALVMGASHTAQAQTPAAASAYSPPSQRAMSVTAVAIPANQATSQDVDAAFQRADSNRDGKLSRQETERFPALMQRFDQVDSNGDHLLSPDEFQQAAGS
ncbi:MAG: EF-hand domain-containing protein [Polaromonas sp.]|nr:EF-hand domain-containing protein [Polaromonas sp.]